MKLCVKSENHVVTDELEHGVIILAQFQGHLLTRRWIQGELRVKDCYLILMSAWTEINFERTVNQ